MYFYRLPKTEAADQLTTALEEVTNAINNRKEEIPFTDHSLNKAIIETLTSILSPQRLTATPNDTNDPRVRSGRNEERQLADDNNNNNNNRINNNNNINDPNINNIPNNTHPYNLRSSSNATQSEVNYALTPDDVPMTPEELENYNKYKTKLEDNDESISESGWTRQSMLEDYILDSEDDILEDEVTNTDEMCDIPTKHVHGSFPSTQNHNRC